jgi:beta-lactam-binding protein with PASTA domain
MAGRMWRTFSKPHRNSSAPVGEVRTSVTVSGDVSGQLAVGSHNVQMRVDTVLGNLVTVLPPNARANVTPRPVPISLVPRRPRLLIGRQNETAIAVEALSSQRAVEIYAPPGMGKSTLLRSLAHQLPVAEACGGMAHLSARGLSHDDLLQVLFDVFYTSDIPVKPPPGELRHHLQHVRAALLLDDVDLSGGDIEDIEDFAPKCGFLLTTQADPGVSEATAIELAGLRGADARELVAHALGRPLAPDEQPAVDVMCDLVHGAPAGLLRLAAAAREHDGSLADFVANAADSGVPPLPVESAKDVRLLGLLAAIPGVHLDVLQLSEITGLADVQERVDRLAARGLLLASAPPVSSGARVDYNLADGVDLGPGGVWQMSQRRAELRDYFMKLAEERSETLLAPGAPPETLRALHSDAARRHDWRYVLGLGVLLDAAYALSGRWDAWREVSETMLTAARAVGDPGAQAMALHQLGTRALCEGETSTATELLRSALDIRTAVGDVAAAQVTQHNLSLIMAPPSVPSEEQDASSDANDKSSLFADDRGASVHASGADVGSSGAHAGGAHASGAHASGAHAVAGQGLSLGAAVPIGASVLVVSAIVAAIVILRPSGSDTAEVALDPEALSFGTAPVNQVSETRSLNARNLGETSVHVDGFRTSGPNSSEFVIQSSTCRNQELAAGGTCSATVIFTPTGQGPRSASVTVDVRELPEDPGAQLSGSSAGQDPASPTAVPSELSFGEQPLNTSGQLRQLRLTGPPGGPVVLGPASVDGVDAADFLVEDNDCADVQLTPGTECAIGVRFTPGGEGPRQGLLRLPSPNGIPDVAVPLSGTGATPEGTPAFEVRPRSVSFGQQPLSAPSEPAEVVVTNTGDAALRVSPMAVVGAPDFTLSRAACPPTLAPGEDCAATVAFTPVATGSRTAQLLFGGGAGPAVPLDGVGAESENAAPGVSPRLLSFGEQLVGGAGPPQTVTLANRADRPLRLNPGGVASATGSFRLDDAGCTAADVPPGGACTVAVTFAPTVAGTHSGYLLLTAEGFPDAAVVLGGLGVDPRAPPVPDLIGLPLADAQAELARAGFGTGTVEQAAHPDIPSGAVSDQVPRGGTPLDQGGTVDLVVSTGPDTVTVPNLVGLTTSEAAERLQEARLRVGAISLQVHPDVPAGHVISSDPVAETEVPTGSPVGLTVSSGSERPRVPDVVGLTESEAAERLLDESLLLGNVARQFDGSIPDDQVMGSDPGAGTEVDAGSTVDLVVSDGPPPVTVPHVVGMTEAAARTHLEGAGLEVGDVTPTVSCEVADGVVITSDPVGGTQVKRDSAVALTVSSGERLASMPDVRGRPEVEALATLQDSGFGTTVARQSDEQVPAGSVIATDPSAGSSASTCVAVTVTVSTGPAPVTVPEVVGFPEADARTAIQGHGLTVGTVTPEASCAVPNGVVISSNPEARTQQVRGTPVGLKVSSGAPQATVPSVAGEPEATAVAAVQNAGFQVRVVDEANETVSEGLVVRSDPAGQASASTCVPVTLVVSSGPPLVTVPEVVGDCLEDAQEELEAVGLQSSVTKAPEPRDERVGEVISSSEEANSQVTRGTTVALVIAYGSDSSDTYCPGWSVG